MTALERFCPPDAVLAWFVYVLASVTCVILVADLWSRAISRRGAAKRHAVWLACLTCVVAAPVVAALAGACDLTLPRLSQAALVIPRPGFVAKSFPSMVGDAELSDLSTPGEPNQSSATALTHVNEPTTVTGRGAGPFAASFNWRAVVAVACWLWLLVGIALVIRLMGGAVLVTRLRRASRDFRSPHLASVVDDVRRATSRRELPPVLASANVDSPVLIGLWRPAIILPERLEEGARREELAHILIHECAHVARGDQWTALFARLASAFYWPHPLVRLVARKLSDAREEVCDNFVLARTEPASYAETLLGLAHHAPQNRRLIVGLAIQGGRGELEARVASLLDTGRDRATRAHGMAFFACAVVFGAVTLAICGMRPAAAQPNAAPTEERPPNGIETASEREGERGATTILGKVIDEQGRGVADIRVHLTRDPANTCMTSIDGAFELQVSNVAPRRPAILARSADGERMGFGRVDTTLAEANSVQLVLKPARRTRVRVFNGDGLPVEGATVELTAGGFNDGEITNTDGVATLRYPADAEAAAIVALKDGMGLDYYDHLRRIDGQRDRPMPDECELVLGQSRSPLRVRVVDGGNQPVEGASVTIGTIERPNRVGKCSVSAFTAATELTDSQGWCEIRWLPKDHLNDLLITFGKSGYAFGDSIEVPRWSARTEFKATLIQQARFSGRVTHGDSPVSGVELLAVGRGEGARYCVRTATSDTDGRYSIEVDPEISYMLGVVDTAWGASSRLRLTPAEGESLANLDFELRTPTMVRGIVTATDGTTPLANRYVGLYERTEPAEHPPVSLTGQLFRSMVTGPDGRFEFAVGPGMFEIELPTTVGRRTVYSQATEVKPVRLQIRDEREVDLHLIFRGLLEGELRGLVVFGDSGGGVPGARVRAGVHGPNLPGSFNIEADGQGRFAIQRLRVPLEVCAASPDGRFAGFAWIDRDAETVAIPLTDAGSISGVIKEKRNGAPIVNCRVFAMMSFDAESFPNFTALNENRRELRVALDAWTDSNGRYRITGVPSNARGVVKIAGPPVVMLEDEPQFIMDSPVDLVMPEFVIDSARRMATVRK